jgi:hypothetical protein
MRPRWTKLAFQIGNGVHYAKAYSTASLVDTFIYLQALSESDLRENTRQDTSIDG